MKDFTHFLRSSFLAFAVAGSLAAAADDTITIGVTDVTTNDASITITPPSNQSYFWNVVDKQTFDANGGAANAVENQIEIWKEYAEEYGYYSWYDAMTNDLYYGNYNMSASERLDESLVYGTEYVVFAFGINYDGDVTIPVSTYEFTTKTPATSDNSFDIKVTSIEKVSESIYSATAHIVPANNDPYIVKCFRKFFVDKYNITPGSDAEKSFIAHNMVDGIKTSNLLRGENDFVNGYCMADQDYYFVVVGVNEDLTPSTSITKVEFKAAVEEEPVTGTLEITVDNVSVQNATVTITPTPDELKYYWNYVDKATFEADGGADKAIENRIEKWKTHGSIYDTPWQEIMNLELQQGKMTESIYDFFLDILMYDTDYVVYAFGMDKEGNVTAPLATAEFRTLTPPASENIFEVSITSIVPNTYRYTATAHVEPSNSDRYVVRFFTKDYVDKFNITPGSEGEKRFIAKEMFYNLNNDMIFSGSANVTYSYCEDGKDYYVVVMGINDDNTPSTSLTLYEFTVVETEKPVLGTLTLEVSDITPMNAHIRITPSDDSIRYYYYITSPKNIERIGGPENIPDRFIIDWWKYVAEMYDMNWKELIPMQTRTGALDDTIENLVEQGELEPIYWNSDWALYAVGFDLDGNVTTNVAVLEFSTPACDQSDLEFEYEMVSVEPDPNYANSSRNYYVVTVDIIPSNDEDSYLVNYMETKYYNQYLEDPVPDMMDFITRQFLPSAIEITGPARLRMPGIAETNAVGDKLEWAIFAMGWNEGPSTDLSIYNLDLNYVGVDATPTDAIKVRPGAGTLSISGDYDRAVVYSVDGRTAGALMPGHHISLPAGIYVVKYTTLEGESKAVKVNVR